MTAPKLNTGSVLDDRYLLGEILGHGSYGTVFKAYDSNTGREVAVKVACGTGHMRKKNSCEAKLLEMFKTSKSDISDFVVSMETWFETEDSVVIVLELLSHDLRESVRRRVFDNLYNVHLYGRQMLEFMLHASRLSLVHGDIKPENILVERGSHRIKFIDFGFSSAPGFGSRDDNIQSLYYRAPEVTLGYSYDESADMWSVGCILLELLLGFPIFRASDELELMQIMAKILGVPDFKFIECAPERDRYFEFCEKHNQWVVKGIGRPVRPIGVNNFVKTFFQGDKSSEPLASLIETINAILQIHPGNRCSPSECLELSFFMPHDPLQYKDFEYKYWAPKPRTKPAVQEKVADGYYSIPRRRQLSF